MPKQRKFVYKIPSTTWRERYRKDWLREIIDKKRNKTNVRPINNWELNELIENKMKELGTCFERDAVEVLIEEVRNGKEY